MFEGRVLNLSGRADGDKEGGAYRLYFRNASEYALSNYSPGARGEIDAFGNLALDLEVPILEGLAGHFDVVLTHTVLEHVFNLGAAFDNVCRLSADVVITVVPFLQPAHGAGYDDFWRFTASALMKLHEQRGLTVSYLSANQNVAASVYLFAVGTKRPDRWHGLLSRMEGNSVHRAQTAYLGTRAILNTPLRYVRSYGKRIRAN